MKSTPVRGVKEYLKPCTYKKWEHYGVSFIAKAFCRRKGGGKPFPLGRKV